MGIQMSFADLDMVEYSQGYLIIPLVIVYQSNSLIHLNWYATKQDAEVGNPYVKQTCYNVDNLIFTAGDIYVKSYEYIMSLPEFSTAVLDS